LPPKASTTKRPFFPMPSELGRLEMKSSDIQHKEY
jgi:hypothetical protein